LATWRQIGAAPFALRAIAAGHLVATRELSSSEAEQAGLAGQVTSGGLPWAGFLQHERIPFVSYPYEWTWGMLRDAALSQLDLLREAFAEGFTLKDGTLYNTQWRGTSPVFIDTVSLERWTPGLPWMGYRQFCQTGLFPLWLQAFWQCPFHPWLRGRLDGMTASSAPCAVGAISSAEGCWYMVGCTPVCSSRDPSLTRMSVVPSNGVGCRPRRCSTR
jgi:hypothetical protein